MGMILSCYANLLFLGEKLSIWITCTALICCIVATITVVLGLGIGLGYNYCFVDMMTRYKYIPAHYVVPKNSSWPYENQGQENPPGGVLIKGQTRMFSKSFNNGLLEEYHDYADNWLQSTSEYDNVQNKDINEVEANIDNSTDSLRAVEDHGQDVTTSPLDDDAYLDNEDIEILKSTTPSLLRILQTVTKRKTSYETITRVKLVTKEAKKMVIPIAGLDLLNLLTKLKADHKNYTLQLISN